MNLSLQSLLAPLTVSQEDETFNSRVFARFGGMADDERFTVEGFEVVEGLSRLWSIQLVVAHPDPNLALEKLVDKGAALALYRPQDAGTLKLYGTSGSSAGPEIRIWTGLCASFVHESTQTRAASGRRATYNAYRVEIVPELWRLSLRTNTRIFQHQSAIDIAERLLKDWDITVEGKNLLLRNITKDDYPKFEYRVQYEESDFAFLCRILEEAGITFYFDYLHGKKLEKFEGRGRELTVLVLDAEPQQAQEGKAAEEDESDEGADDDGADDAEEEEDEEEEDGDEGSEKKDAPKRVYGPLPYRGTTTSPHSGEVGEFVVNAQIGRRLRPGAVTLVDHDFRLSLGARANGTSAIVDPAASEPKPLPAFGVPLRQRPNEDSRTTEQLYEIFQYVPGGLHYEKERTEGDAFPPGHSPFVARRAENTLRGARADARIVYFETNALSVAPGTVIKFGLSDYTHPRDELSKQVPQLVTETVLSGTRVGDWVVRCQAVPTVVVKRDDEGEAETIPVPYRPPMLTPHPRIHGVQSAIVVGPPSADKEQIHCDKHGRVRVQFHWDRQHKYGEQVPKEVDEDALGSAWVRVSTPMAGSGYGFVSIPRVGQEVLVSFLDGNPERPIIVGSVYSEPNPAPYRGDATKTGIKTKTSPDPKGFNEMYFDDKTGAERIHVQAEKDLSTIVKNSETRSVGSARMTRVGTQDKLHAGNLWELVVGQTGTGIQARSNNSILVQVGGAGGATILLTQGGSDSGVFFNAAQDMHFHATGMIHLSAKGRINIDGTVVKINDGNAHEASVKHFADGGAREGGPSKTAQRPDPGAPHNPGPKGVGGGGMPSAPHQLADDLEFKRPPPEEQPRFAPGALQEASPFLGGGDDALVPGAADRPGGLAGLSDALAPAARFGGALAAGAPAAALVAGAAGAAGAAGVLPGAAGAAQAVLARGEAMKAALSGDMTPAVSALVDYATARGLQTVAAGMLPASVAPGASMVAGFLATNGLRAPTDAIVQTAVSGALAGQVGPLGGLVGGQVAQLGGFIARGGK